MNVDEIPDERSHQEAENKREHAANREPPQERRISRTGASTGAKRSNKAGKAGNKSKRTRKPVRDMRICALPGCGIAFYPSKEWQKFHDPKCALKDRQRRYRERYRDLKKLNSGSIVAGVGGRKAITRRGSKEITPAETKVIEQIRRIGQPAMDAVRAVLSRDLMTISTVSTVSTVPPAPVPASHSPPTTMKSVRLRNVQRVHPRSLER
jgi:hypothetical protein